MDLGCILVPLIASFHPAIKFHKKIFPFVLVAILGTMVVFIPWDIVFTAHHIWSFNPEYILGHNFLNLPLEEWLFFICIPYACLFTYACIRQFITRLDSPVIGRRIALAIGIIFLIVAFTHFDRSYTFVSHLLCGIFLLLHVFVLKSKWLAHFWVMYVFIFPLFLISNGILTGLDFWQYHFFNSDPDGITDQIVSYNNAENLGFRLFSVPLDDISYGMLMLLLNTSIYEYLNRILLHKKNPLA